MQLYHFSYLVLFLAAPKPCRCCNQVIGYLLQQPKCHRRGRSEDAMQIFVDCLLTS